MTEYISEPKIDDRPEKVYMGIRTQTPMKGMFQVVDVLRKELFAWQKEQGVQASGPHFLRYHVIDMAGEMDIELGFIVADTVPGNDRIRPGVLPAGRYASLIYSRYALAGNKRLIEWAKDNGIQWDRWDEDKGDAFRCRCEFYLTDPKVEHRKSKWQVELAIKMADGQ
jgi:effector-binding domain-containing protein